MTIETPEEKAALSHQPVSRKAEATRTEDSKDRDEATESHDEAEQEVQDQQIIPGANINTVKLLSLLRDKFRIGSYRVAVSGAE